ncbi:MAG: hypothetical protein ABII26_09950 [Pseudomonadota bacterium]
MEAILKPRTVDFEFSCGRKTALEEGEKGGVTDQITFSAIF